MVSRRDNEALDLKVGNSGEMRQASEMSGRLFSVTKLNVSLPNGAKLLLECDDVHALTAVIGAVSDVKLASDVQVYFHREPIDFWLASLALLFWCRRHVA